MKKREIISVAFVVTLLISNILGVKLFALGNFVLPAAVIIYPFCFMVGDVLTEVWGYSYAKKVIYLGFISNFIVVLFIYLGELLPPAPVWPNQEAYITLFGLVPRLVIASFLTYLAGELLNSWSLEKIKVWIGVKFLFVRTIGSSIVGQLVDTAIFILIAFYGFVPNNVLLTMVLSQYVTKVILEAVAGTPLAYLLVAWANNDNSLDISRLAGRK